jgi:hypothetical protein
MDPKEQTARARQGIDFQPLAGETGTNLIKENFRHIVAVEFGGGRPFISYLGVSLGPYIFVCPTSRSYKSRWLVVSYRASLAFGLSPVVWPVLLEYATAGTSREAHFLPGFSHGPPRLTNNGNNFHHFHVRMEICTLRGAVPYP